MSFEVCNKVCAVAEKEVLRLAKSLGACSASTSEMRVYVISNADLDRLRRNPTCRERRTHTWGMFWQNRNLNGTITGSGEDDFPVFIFHHEIRLETKRPR